MPATMLYVPPPESSIARTPIGWRPLVAAVSHPAMVAVLLLCCHWMALWPKKHPMLRRLRARLPAQPVVD